MNIPQYQPIDYTAGYNRIGSIAASAVGTIGDTVNSVLNAKDLKVAKEKTWSTVESDMRENGAKDNEIKIAKATFDGIENRDQLHNYVGAYAQNSQAYKAAVSQYGADKKDRFPRPALGLSDTAYQKHLDLFTGLADKAQKTQDTAQKFQAVQGLAKDVQGGQGVAAMQNAVPPSAETELPGLTAAGRTLGASTAPQLPGLTPQGQTLGAMPAGREQPALQAPTETPPSAQELAATAQPENPNYSATQIAAAGAERGVGGEAAVKNMVDSAKAEDAQKLKQQQYELQVQKWADNEARRNKDLDLIDAKITDLSTHPERFNRDQLNKEAYLILQFKNKSDSNLKDSENYVGTLRKALSQIHGKGIEGEILAELQAKNGQKNFDEEWLTSELHNAQTDLTLQKTDSKQVDAAYDNFQSEIAKQHTITGKAMRDARKPAAAPTTAPAPAPAATPVAGAGSPVGTVKPGRTGTYRKKNDGPDTDANNWEKVS
jgi:hypothetical protein